MPSDPPARRRAWVPPEAWASLVRFAADHGFPVLVVVFATLTAYGSALFVLPFDLDNVVALSASDRSHPFGFFTHSIRWAYADTGGSVPIYRPLAYATVWVQEKAGGLGAEQYFRVNLALWLACALGLYAIVHTLTRSRVGAAAAASVFAVDGRALNALIWIAERQSTMACLFGLLALLAVIRWGDSPRRPLLVASVAVLLCLSALSKEYGLAFLVAVPLLAGLTRPRHWRAVTLAAAGALGVYVVFRFGLAGGATGAYCEDMGLFKRHHRVCYDALGFGGRMKQYLYNVGATFVGTFFPQFFNEIGVVRKPGGSELVAPAIVTGLAAYAAARRPRIALPLLALVAANALLSFLVYRPRNQVIAIAGLDGAAGIGLAISPVLTVLRLRARSWMTGAAVCAVALVFAWTGWHATHTTARALESYRSYAEGLNPCQHLRDFPKNVKADVVYRLKRIYLLDNPTCRRS